PCHEPGGGGRRTELNGSDERSNIPPTSIPGETTVSIVQQNAQFIYYLSPGSVNSLPSDVAIFTIFNAGFNRPKSSTRKM
ncbi:hypothetical protein K0M31_000005, partial [Melipona bicolor]